MIRVMAWGTVVELEPELGEWVAKALLRARLLEILGMVCPTIVTKNGERCDLNDAVRDGDHLHIGLDKERLWQEARNRPELVPCGSYQWCGRHLDYEGYCPLCNQVY